MRSYSLFSAAAVAFALTGCVSYPVYQSVPVARLTPAQSAALASRPIDQAEQDRYAAADAEVQREDFEAQRQQRYTYAYPAYPAYSYGYYGYPAPYYGGFYPWYPGLSLSFGFRSGGYYRGGYRGGYHGGGFRGHRW